MLISSWWVMVDVAEAEVDEDERAGSEADGVQRVQLMTSPIIFSQHLCSVPHRYHSQSTNRFLFRSEVSVSLMFWPFV